MKTPAVIILIIMGSLLIVAPVVADYLHRSQIVEALQQSGANHLTLGESLSEIYRFGCWLVGTLMVGSAILSSREHKR